MGDLKIGRMILGMCQTNCYYLYREGERMAVVVDPADRGDLIQKELEGKGLTAAVILLTHGHFDHIWGVNELRRLSKAPVYAFEAERALLGDAGLNVSAAAGRAETVEADYWLKEGEQVTLAAITFQVIGTAGHTAGSCCYYVEDEQLLLSGDTLFEASVGRTDLPTGSMSTLVRSIREKLFALPDEVTVYPGHGDMTEIGEERQCNPFCQ